MKIGQVVAELEKILGVRIPEGTLRRWASEGLIIGPKYYGQTGQRGGRFCSWPLETVEDAAVVYSIRNRNLPWGMTIRGWPSTKAGRDKTVSKKILLEVKKMAEHLYASVNKNPQSIDFNDLFGLLKPTKLSPKGGCMYGSYATHPVFVAWITTLEKIRRNKPLEKPLHFIFNWRVHLVGEQDLKLKYDGIAVKKSKCEMVGVSVGKYTPEAWKKQFGTEPIDWEKANSEGRVMTFYEPWIKMEEDPEHKQTIVSDPVTGIKIAIKKADPAEWGPPPWEIED